MLKIGEFSRLSRVTVQTLRHYDDLGLLKPSEVDTFTGYRHYLPNQLLRLYRILALKDLGFSLEQISRLLESELSAQEMHGMLKMKQVEIEQHLEEEQARLARVAARLRQIEMQDTLTAYEVLVKSVEPQKVAAVRGIVPTYGEQGALWDTLIRYLSGKPITFTGAGLSVYYDDGYKERDVDLDVCQPFNGTLPESDRVRVMTLPGGLFASTLHRGSYDTLSDGYEALLTWTPTNGYRIVGPAREVYLHQGDSRENPDNVVEVQVPVERA